MPCARNIEDAVRQVETHRMEWLEDILAGLLSAGVPKEEIEICNSRDARTTWVRVRGETKYEHVIEYGQFNVKITAN